MPLVIEHEINLIKYKGEKCWLADCEVLENITMQWADKSPQIALATCLLKVLQSKEGDK